MPDGSGLFGVPFRISANLEQLRKGASLAGLQELARPHCSHVPSVQVVLGRGLLGNLWDVTMVQGTFSGLSPSSRVGHLL